MGGPDSQTAGTSEGDKLPRRFGKYTLMRKLAVGGMAELYLAIHRSISGFEKLVVIKQILPQFTADAEFVRMFMDEARIAATLSHPNVIQIFDVGAVGDRYFIAMEFIHGEDLRAVVKGMVARKMKEFPVEHALQIVIGICAGLDYAHSKKDFSGEPLGIVHRDISPQNILVTFTGDVKLVDFGIAKAALGRQADAISFKGMEEAAKEEEGQLRGKFPYMSPEQCRGQPLDHRSDIFSLGIVLFELTTGRRLFRAKSEVETIRKIVEHPYPHPTQVRPGYPPALEAIVLRALSRDRDARYQSARELQAELENFVREDRIPCSSIALSNFMHELFGDKLTAQRQAMAEGKQLADVIATESEAAGEIRFEDVADVTSVPTVTPRGRAATGTWVPLAPRKSRAGLWAGLAALGVALAVGGVVLFSGGGGDAAAPPLPPEQPDVAAAAVEDTAPPPPVDTWTPPPEDVAPPPQKAEGVLLFAGIPPGMRVFLDGQLLFENSGATPVDFPARRTVEGEHEIRLEHADYVAEPFTVMLDPTAVADTESYGPGWPVPLAERVRPLAEGEVFVFLTIMDEDAVLTINDVPTAYRPGEELKVRATLRDGNVSIEVAKRSHETVRRTLRPTSPGEVRLAAGIYLTRQGGTGPRTDGGTTPPPPGGRGSLRVRCEPWASVTVPGFGTRNSPFSMELPAGTYRLQFSNPDEGRQNAQTVTIAADDTVKITDCW